MNISEFAEAAGVSKSAVSRYFNDGYLSRDKREKIENALKATGYMPSQSAQSMRTRITKLVGVILPKLSSESCARITEGISEVLEEEGYQLLLVNTGNDYHKEIEYLELFRNNRVDGVIFLASVFTDRHKNVLRKMHIPVIITGQTYQGFNCVCHDDAAAAYELTKHMLGKGRKCPGYIGVTELDQAAGKNRHEGFRRALTEYGLTEDPVLSAAGEFTVDSGYSLARRLFSGKNRPDALFCATDNIAAGAMLYCVEHDISIPGDVMICAVGDSKLGRITAVPLTSAHLHYKTAGREAAYMLLSALLRGSSVPRVLRLDFELVLRASTGD